MPTEKLEPNEVGAAFAARRELGPQYELELAESLVDRVNAVIDSRLATQRTRRPPLDWAQMTLGLGSLALCIPLVAILQNSMLSVLVVLGLVGVVNLAYAVKSSVYRRRDY
ncbi:hypothetical protein J5X84_17870 [Streptosporangiaceae bacterium NEAU-GS5]|nr:hypothetical protein [Streptosporangiaceae bacterium NEAU-GS5]